MPLAIRNFRQVIVLGQLLLTVLSFPCAIFVQQSEKTYSPLHDFLNIDAETGQFKPEQPSADDASNATGNSIGGDTAVNPTATDDNFSIQAENATKAFKRAAEQLNDGSLADLESIFDSSLRSHPLLRLHEQIVWFSVVIMMIYPLGIMVSTLAGRFSRRDREHWTDIDRRYQRIRVRRRLTLSVTIGTLLVVLGFGAANGYWWDRPTLLTLFATVVLILGVISVVLSNLIKEAAKNQQLDLIRTIRSEQLELRADVEELRLRFQQPARSASDG